MSQWTHVNGNIRIDGIPGMSEPIDFCITKTYEDGDFEEATVPYGSEGSLQYSVSKVGNGLVWLNVQIWGDLRDYDNTDEIIQWIKNKTKGHMIRSGIVEIDVEFSDNIIMYSEYDEETNEHVWKQITIKKEK